MNFLDLYKKIRALETDQTTTSLNESTQIEECGMSECGMDPAVAPKQQDSVSMSVNMNASGVGGIRDLMNVLQNLEKSIDTEKDVVIGKGPSEPVDIDISADEEMAPPTMPELPVIPDMHSSSTLEKFKEPASDEEVISDEFDTEKDYANDPEIRKMSVAAVMGTGDDIHSKGKEALKQAGGGNPWNISESKIAAKLAKHYEEVKSRNNVTEGYWGWDPPDEPDPYYGHGEGTIELELPAPYDINLNSEDYDVAKGEVSIFNVSYDANGDTFDITSVVYYTGDYPDVQIDLNKVDPKWFNYVSEKMDDILEKRAGSSSDDYDGGYNGGYDDSSWQDAQNRWEKGRDSRY